MISRVSLTNVGSVEKAFLSKTKDSQELKLKSSQEGIELKQGEDLQKVSPSLAKVYFGARITDIVGRQIFDSRGNPTVEVDVYTENGTMGRAAVPSGASTGEYEAVELRDTDKKQDYMGKGVLTAVGHVNNEIRENIIGMDTKGQFLIDTKMMNLDGTPNKGKFGANAILGVSLAVADAEAKEQGIPLYMHFRKLFHELGGKTNEIYNMPVPMMNILNGGMHADNNVNIQEFMILPVGAKSFADAMKINTEIYHNLKKILQDKENNGYGEKLSTAVGDEGGFAPNLKQDTDALDFIVKAIDKAGYTGKVKLGLDVAASSMWKNGAYEYKDGTRHTTDEMIDYYAELVDKYPIISIEDGLDENDAEGWVKITERLGNKIQIVGDDRFVTNPERLQNGIDKGEANSILIKLNQIGSLTETLETIKLAHDNHYTSVISHRSGETEDTAMADLTVATSNQIKSGAPCRTDRVAKYNQLLRIEEDLKKRQQGNVPYAGESAFKI